MSILPSFLQIMANTKSAIKNHRKTVTRTQRNRATKSRLKTLSKNLSKVATGEDADVTKAAAITYVSALDKAAKKNVISKNSASRLKARCSKYIVAK